jgi:hypothetical protein
MRTYLVTCDAAAPVRHRVASAIMQLSDAWARPLDATWYVQSSLRPGAMRDELQGQLDPDAGLLIQEVEADAVLLNATLTWFRRRKPRTDAAEAVNVVAFPAPAEPRARAA